MIQQTQHLHKYDIVDDNLVCDCGKRILNFVEDITGIKKGIRSNGREYSKKDNQNRFLFPEEYYKIYDLMKGRQQDTLYFLLNTGVRIAEGQKTEKTDLTYNPKGRSRLNIRFTKTKARKGEHKVGKPRLIPVSSKFAKHFNKWINNKDNYKHLNFNLLSTPAFNIAFKKAAKKAGIEDYHNLSAHTLRKTLEVWLMALGVGDLKLVAHIGHSIGTAASSYISPDVLSREDRREIRHILGDLYDE